MEKYRIVNKLGEGSYGVVYRAVDMISFEIVAIKQVKKIYGSWKECLNLREVKSLLMMKHPNIVHLREVVREYGVLYLVFEFMESNLFQAMRQRNGHRFSEEEIKNLCFQVFQGLNYMHRRGYFHRDLKPENLLVSGDKIKIADLGMAREIFSAPPYTEYVMTRWYRAPEVMLRSKNYNFKVDMWSMGVIMAEMFTSRAIFTGKSEIDQIGRICSLIGAPTVDSWPEGICLARAQNLDFHGFGGKSLLPSLLHRFSASNDAIDLIQRLCSWDPAKRPMVADVLQHPFFSSCYKLERIYRSPTSLIERCREYNSIHLSKKLSFHSTYPKFVPADGHAAVYDDCPKNVDTVGSGALDFMHCPKLGDDRGKPITELCGLISNGLFLAHRNFPENVNIQAGGCDCGEDVWLGASRALDYSELVYERDKPATDICGCSSGVIASQPEQSFLMGKRKIPKGVGKGELGLGESGSDVVFSDIEQRVTENLSRIRRTEQYCIW